MQLTKLLRFVEINADAVRKILKKHDRRLLTDDQALGSYLTTRVSRNPDSHLRQLFWHNGLNAIVSSLKGVIEEMPANCRTLQDSYGRRASVVDKEGEGEVETARNKGRGWWSDLPGSGFFTTLYMSGQC